MEMLTLPLPLVVALVTFAPAPLAPEGPGRVPAPPPALREQLHKFDLEYRHGSEAKFAELEKLADALAKRFPRKDHQACIWYEVAHVAGQSGIDKQAARVRKYAARCLAVSRDPLQRGHMYTYRACAVNLSGAAFAAGRREAAEILLTGYAELLARKLPAKAPELPPVHTARVAGDPAAEARARARQAAQIAARREAEFTAALVARRDTLVLQLRDLFKPEPNYHGRNPEGPDELRALAKKKLTARQVDVLLEKVTR
jgi:hypothetical protein